MTLSDKRNHVRVFDKKRTEKVKNICVVQPLLYTSKIKIYMAINFQIQQIKQKYDDQISYHHHITFSPIKVQWFRLLLKFLVS